MINPGKIIKVLPNNKAVFQLLICSKGNKTFLLFKLGHALNVNIVGNKTSDGVYSFSKHPEIFKWVFFTYKRHISKTCWNFLLNHYPEIIESIFKVYVLPTKSISQKKWSEFFERKHSGKYQEIFPNEEPDESIINPNFYEVKASIDGRVLNDSEYFMVTKAEYIRWKKQYGKDTPFVITRENQFKVS